MTRNSRNRLRWFCLLAGVGTTFQFGACGTAANYVRNLNPCIIILACDPAAFNFLTSGYQGPGVNPDIDPACTFPPFCANDPFVATPQ